MRKSVLLSIRPRWCELIASGQKTVEVRRNRPKLQTPFKVYIYCTMGGDTIRTAAKPYCKNVDGSTVFRQEIMNGRVIGEFVCDEIYKFSTVVYLGDEQTIADEDVVHQSCISRNELRKYEKYKKSYGLCGWHISALQIYDKPRELREFGVSRAPQSWQYVEVCE